MNRLKRSKKSRARSGEDSYYSEGSRRMTSSSKPPMPRRRDDGHHYYDEYSYDSRDSRTWGQDPYGYQDNYSDGYDDQYSYDSRDYYEDDWSRRGHEDRNSLRQGPDATYYQRDRGYPPRPPVSYEYQSRYYPTRDHRSYDSDYDPSSAYSGSYSDQQQYGYNERSEMYVPRQHCKPMSHHSRLLVHKSPSNSSSRSRNNVRRVEALHELRSMSVENGAGPLEIDSFSLDGTNSLNDLSLESPPMRRTSSKVSHKSMKSRASSRSKLSMVSETGKTVQAGNLGPRYNTGDGLSSRSSGSSKMLGRRILSKGSSTTFGSKGTDERYYQSEVRYADDKAKELLDDLADMGYEVDSRDGVVPKDSLSTMEVSERYGKLGPSTSMNSNRSGLSGKWKPVVVAQQDDETIESILPIDEIEVVVKETADSGSTGSRGPSTRTSQESTIDETISTRSSSSVTKETKETNNSSTGSEDNTFECEEEIERMDSGSGADMSNDNDFDESTISTKETREQRLQRLSKMRRTTSSLNSKRVGDDEDFAGYPPPTGSGYYVPGHVSANGVAPNVSDITSVMSIGNSVVFPNLTGAVTDKFERVFEHLALNCRYALSKN
jgi:hypothetical protein